MGQQKLALAVFDCLIKNYVFALVEYFLNALGSKCCSVHMNIFPSVLSVACVEQTC